MNHKISSELINTFNLAIQNLENKDKKYHLSNAIKYYLSYSPPSYLKMDLIHLLNKYKIQTDLIIQSLKVDEKTISFWKRKHTNINIVNTHTIWTKVLKKTSPYIVSKINYSHKKYVSFNNDLYSSRDLNYILETEKKKLLEFGISSGKCNILENILSLYINKIKKMQQNQASNFKDIIPLINTLKLDDLVELKDTIEELEHESKQNQYT